MYHRRLSRRVFFEDDRRESSDKETGRGREGEKGGEKKNLMSLFNVTGPVITRRLVRGNLTLPPFPPAISSPSVITKLA